MRADAPPRAQPHRRPDESAPEDRERDQGARGPADPGRLASLCARRARAGEPDARLDPARTRGDPGRAGRRHGQAPGGLTHMPGPGDLVRLPFTIAAGAAAAVTALPRLVVALE